MDVDARPSLEQVYAVGKANHLRPESRAQCVRSGAIPKKLHAMKQITVSNSRGAEHDTAARGQLIRTVNLVQRHPGFAAALCLGLIPGHELPLNLATKAFECSCGQHALRRATSSHDGMNVGAAYCCGDGTNHVAIPNELDRKSVVEG